MTKKLTWILLLLINFGRAQVLPEILAILGHAAIDATQPKYVPPKFHNGLIVIKDDDNKGFTVKEKNNGNSNISFSFRIMAKRLHFQDHRFGNDPVWGDGDTRQYNQYATQIPLSLMVTLCKPNLRSLPSRCN